MNSAAMHRSVGLRARFSAREILLEGSSVALTQFAEILVHGSLPLVLALEVPSARESAPYEGFLHSINCMLCEGPLHIGRKDHSLHFVGSLTSYELLADTVRDLAILDETKLTGTIRPHAHFDASSNDGIAEGSDSLVIVRR